MIQSLVQGSVQNESGRACGREKVNNKNKSLDLIVRTRPDVSTSRCVAKAIGQTDTLFSVSRRESTPESLSMVDSRSE